MIRNRLFDLHRFLSWFACTIFLFGTVHVADAQLSSNYYDQVVQETLQDNAEYQAQQKAIADKSLIINGIEDRLTTLQNQIIDLQSQAVSLQQHIDLLDTDIAANQEEITKTNVEIESLQLEIESLQRQIRTTQNDIDSKKNTLQNTMQELYIREQLTPIEVTASHQSLSAYYQSLEYGNQVQAGVNTIVQDLQQDEQVLQQQQQSHKEKKAALSKKETDLEQQQVVLQDEKTYKQSILQDTESSEEKFQELYEQAKRDRQQVQADIDTSLTAADLIKEQARQAALKKLDRDPNAQLTTQEEVALTDNVTFIWPSYGLVTCSFHCADYPYESWIGPHTGTDIAVPVGTPVIAAADGCVSQVAYPVNSSLAYVVMTNGGNFSTAYLHLSRIDVQPYECVKQGTVIGASGGGIGVPGAGLSTGPHLHFEIRYNRVAVDAQDYLPFE
jgi:murein DD-endopeptidase MepM/ murein hydrolase activator NlpD